jgi:hypothetical protein
LTAVTISGTAKITTVPARERDALVGRKAIFDLVEDSLVPAGSIADAAVPSTGRAVVGLRLTAGRAPVGLLTPGSPVRLVSVPSADQAPSDRSAGTRTFLARVVSQSDGNDGASILVNVDVAAADAPAIALLSAQDRLAVLRDADR